ncbi:hypothetical protein EXU29_00095 [Acinetobacter wuhouensis]|uniref:hypothetical protein n=1 Tax=Acinetobacter wuhouensis TaxID=1879050 RepID=UPI001022FF58|nr:hypothetical protein [Acinetobacter wuhouensis]RZG75854.1 hypothetical protein EXU29_00095 [Acinetobacter wuhouensis]
MLKLIDQQPHFWELYQDQDQDQYYLSIAVDMSSVVSCWDIQLTDSEAEEFRQQGRVAIEDLTNAIVAETYRGDFSNLEARAVSEQIKQEIQTAFKAWRMATR